MKNTLNLTLIGTWFLLLGLGCSGPVRTGPNSTAGNKAIPAEKPIEIAATALTKEYDSNEIAADGKYKGKRLAVTGKVSDIAETFGRVTMQIEGHNNVITVMCSFDEKWKNAIAQKQKGVKATMTGVVDGLTVGLYVGLTDCIPG